MKSYSQLSKAYAPDSRSLSGKLVASMEGLLFALLSVLLTAAVTTALVEDYVPAGSVGDSGTSARVTPGVAQPAQRLAAAEAAPTAPVR